MFKTLAKYAFSTLSIIILSLLVYRAIIMSQIPAVQKKLPFRVIREEMPQPKRPGTRSVRIVGPPLKIIKFQIDFKRHPTPLDWSFLERIDNKADVMVHGEIDANGNFVVNKVQDKGHPKAGRYIKKVLASWKFVHYKMGIIKYYFNVPSRIEQMKVQIDLRGLEKNLKYIGPKSYVKDGMLYYIEGIDKSNIRIIN